MTQHRESDVPPDGVPTDVVERVANIYAAVLCDAVEECGCWKEYTDEARAAIRETVMAMHSYSPHGSDLNNLMFQMGCLAFAQSLSISLSPQEEGK